MIALANRIRQRVHARCLRIFWINVPVQDLQHALAHFSCGLARERDGQNFFRCVDFGQQAKQPLRQYSGFA